MRTLARGLQLLEIVARSPNGASVTEAAGEADLDKATVSRLLSALRQLGYVRQRHDRSYALSGKVLGLARSYEQQLNLREVAKPHLVTLRDDTQETVHLAIREARQLVYIDHAEPDRSVRLASVIGLSLPLHVTAMGRAVLAAMPLAESDALVRQLIADPHFADFVVDLDHIRDEIEHARADGWATVERDDDVSRVGVAIVDASGEPVGAISVSGPSYRMDDRIETVATHCLATGRTISAALGG